MKKESFILLFFLLLSAFSVFSQSKIDSLKTVVHGTEKDSNIAYAYMLLGIEYATRDVDSSAQFYDLATQLCTENNWFLLHGKVLTNQAYDAHYISNSESCLVLMDSAIHFCEKSESASLILIAYYNKGFFLSEYGSIEEAIESYLIALSYREKANNPTYTSYALNNLGYLYRELGAYDKAIEAIIETIKLKESINEATLGYSYSILAKNYESINESQQAIDQFKSALKIYLAQNDSGRIGVCYRNIAQNLLKLKAKDSAAIYLQKAFKLFRTLEYDNQLALTFLAQSELEEMNGDNSKQELAIDSAEFVLPKEGFDAILADIYFKKSKLLFERKSNKRGLSDAVKNAHQARSIWLKSQSLEKLVLTSEVLSNLYESLGKGDSALYYSRVFTTLKDSLLAAEKMATVRRLNVEFQTEKRMAKIATLNEENALKEERLKAAVELERAQQIVIIVLAVGLLLLAILIYVIWRIFNANKKAHNELKEQSSIIEKQNTEREYLLKEIHHRVKNNLQIISSLLDMQLKGLEDQKLRDTLIESRSRVASMALIHQLLYEGNSQARVNLKPYTEQLTSYISQSFGKDNRAKLKLNIDDDLTTNIETAIPFGLIVTELMTNAYKYAFINTENNLIDIGVTVIGESYALSFSDNGIGLPEGLDVMKTKSLGLRLVKNLTQQLKGKLTYTRLEGTTFKIEFFEKQLN